MLFCSLKKGIYLESPHIVFVLIYSVLSNILCVWILTDRQVELNDKNNPLFGIGVRGTRDTGLPANARGTQYVVLCRQTLHKNTEVFVSDIMNKAASKISNTSLASVHW